MRRHLTTWDLGFLILMMLGIAAAVYHATHGRYANALMAIGAVILGTIVLLTDQTARQLPAQHLPHIGHTILHGGIARALSTTGHPAGG